MIAVALVVLAVVAAALAAAVVTLARENTATRTRLADAYRLRRLHDEIGRHG